VKNRGGVELNKALKERWSPRAFSEKKISDEMLHLLFEAARWAPSSRNAQPWSYYYARCENKEKFSQLLSLLTGNNPDWAQHARVLVISVMKKISDFNNRPNGKALHDAGAANVLLSVQASHMGFQAHQMGGFDKAKATAFLRLDPEIFEPVTMIALGFPGDPGQLPEDLKARELQPRTRKNHIAKDLSE